MLLIYWGLLSLLIYIYIKWLNNKHKNSIPFIFLFLFEAVWYLFSIIYIENATFSSEIFQHTYFTGATFRLLVIFIPFFVLTPIIFTKIINNNMYTDIKLHFGFNPFHLNLIFQFVSIICGLYLLLNLFVSGNPFTNTAITRFNFYIDFSRLPMAGRLEKYVVFFSIVNGIIFFSKDIKLINKILALISLAVFIAAKIITGEKFFGIFMCFFFFVTYKIFLFFTDVDTFNIFVKKYADKKLKKFLFAVLVIALLFIIISYNLFFSNMQNPFDALVSRIFSLQSAMYWGMDNYINYQGIEFNLNSIAEELKGGLTGASVLDPNVGLVKMMYKIAPKDLVDLYISNYIRFYGGYFVVSLNYIGFIGTIFLSVILSFLYALLFCEFYKALKNREYLLIFIFSIFFVGFYDYFRVGNLSYLLSINILRYLVVLLFIYLLKWESFKKLSSTIR